MGIMKNAPDAKAAKVFMNWFLGKFALTKAAMEYGHTPLNKEVHSPPRTSRRWVWSRARRRSANSR